MKKKYFLAGMMVCLMVGLQLKAAEQMGHFDMGHDHGGYFTCIGNSCSLSNCKLSGNLYRAFGYTFTNVDFSDATFDRALIGRVNFINCTGLEKLKNVPHYGAVSITSTKAPITQGCKLDMGTSMQVRGGSLNDCKLTGSMDIVLNTTFTNIDFTKTNFFDFHHNRSAILENVKFINCRGVNLRRLEDQRNISFVGGTQNEERW